MPRHIQTYLTFVFMLLFPILLVVGSLQLCLISGGSGLPMKNTGTYLKFLFLMLFPILLVVRTWIILFMMLFSILLVVGTWTILFMMLFSILLFVLFIMLFPILLVAGIWIVLYARIPVNSVCSPTIGMTSQRRYDVFLSFRGTDVRRSFVDHLYNALTSAGIHVFLDTLQRNKGKQISTTIKHAIESSRIRIPIFSPGYAESLWCLEEILLIAQQKQGTTIPLFYKVAPSHVRDPEQPRSPFSQAFVHYQSRKEINGWKAALFDVSCLCGWSLDDTNGFEAELVKRVVQRVRELCKNEGAGAL